MRKQLNMQEEGDASTARTHRRLNDLRMQPLSSLPMTIFMMWMVGNDVSIFSIVFVGMAVTNPLQSMLGAAKVFEEFNEEAEKDPHVRSAVGHSKLIYIACCFAALAVALIKLNWMGLMPVNAMDWLDSTPPQYKEQSMGTFFS
ncbi:Protein of unknown function (DUF1077), putative [Trypanosoma equiperdum]|uniref:ER membrane protein complex subunit 4 n=4 Tax=Trypanozoon TaxID=39700 RepID=Q584P6_TRYB2|nr:hypothetical protein, conserved [Trypanosoma brucei gambiense DAL972]XP_845381.1 hypothetical protein, conserved [Trypanosoma brucei brucei TREU927]AAX80892.1 hypothetical protein, conserved [Trypanosoma brucei]RHW72168.1 hypothetical protein DPX39_060029100 [Trypanosoma brucei equiperdum]SCU69087.1 Protein of unknown function (DUF1077), putative [Trypanosoma equiperdum]AAZ11822.1 hypothetical protein, conserved [Trypanosoma brucei brucei TREU927]CBH11758.1 hypothetical protein, conserved |eukprot:XP_011774043.1 hypothetical protein, conserved [Trypanosoma brucei gambiense DAL972]